ncbi:rab GTPase-binding effector protein 1-like [Anneissia japonica]|uniref:rab GTPase-binding effector protein 1-like n=1 Tax=Anneissia japonica TaxID=1529436 RepID=UPI00142570D2|nr:rab GTPase-binding effector protein 1-like [Anneissia japonica]
MENQAHNLIGMQEPTACAAAGGGEGSVPRYPLSGGARYVDVGQEGLEIDSVNSQPYRGPGSVAAPGSQNNEVMMLQSEITQLQKNQQLLIQQRQALEADFAQKRAKFKELFLAREAELVKEANDIQKERDNYSKELEEIKTLAAFAETSKYEELNEVKAKHQQDIASMQKMVDEAVAVTTAEVGASYQQERLKLLEANDRLSEELQKIHSYVNEHLSGESEKGILSAVTKSFKSLTVSASPSKDAAGTTNDDSSMESSMIQARKDSDMLKAIIIPLEAEMENLKKKLNSSERENKHLKDELEQLKPDSTGSKSSRQRSGANADLEERVQELIITLENEKASRSDLEMYVAVLNKQKSVLQEEVDTQSKELVDVCQRLEKEKNEHDTLKQTWQMANDQFLEMQRLQMNDMRRFQAVLSAEQQRQIQEMQEKDREREEQEQRIKNLQSMRDRHSQEIEEIKAKEMGGDGDRTSKRGASSPIPTPSSNTHHKTPEIGGTSDDSLAYSNSGSEGSRTYRRSISDVSEIMDTPLSHNQVDLSDSGVDGINPDTQSIASSYSLTEAQEKAILSETPEGERMRSVVASVTAPSEFMKVSSGQRIVSEKEWIQIQEQIRQSREKLGRPCDMCVNYEQQLQKVQSTEIAFREQVAALQMDVRQQQEKVKKEMRQRSELEECLKNAAEDAQRQIRTLTAKNKESEDFLCLLRQDYLRNSNELHDQLQMFIQSREQVYEEVTKLQEENKNLIGKRAIHTSIANKDGFQMPDTKEECQEMLTRYREDMINIQVSIDHENQKLTNEISFLKNQLESEQHTRMSLDQTYQQELEEYKDDHVKIRSIKDELNRTTTSLQELEKEHKSLIENSQRNEQLTESLKQENKQLQEIKINLESNLRQSKLKTHDLQQILDNSEAVQHDLVKLSQTLQVQLENVRQTDNEVRWEHEDDVENCHRCKQHLKDKKKKHHCMHCCKIFCIDCLSKSVESGPRRRKMQVCDVCHTLLVNESAPYFSKEAPDTS